MANFCKYCGRPLAGGEVCNCKAKPQSQLQNQDQSQGQIQQPNQWYHQSQQQVQFQNQAQSDSEPYNWSQQPKQAQNQVQQELKSQNQAQQIQNQVQQQIQFQSHSQSKEQTQWQPQGQNEQGNQQHTWQQTQQQSLSQSQWTDWTKSASIPYPAADGFWSTLKEHMGIGEPEYNNASPYEEGMKIIPDIVKPNEGEVPIRQYQIATLRNKVAGVTYAKATGRIQVTNKRVIFRAPGKSIIGTRTSLQHEFLIDEIGGIEARREHIFNKGDMFLSLIAAIIGSLIMTRIVGNSIERDMSFRSLGATCYFLALFFGTVGIVPFFAVKKHWFLKAFLAGVSGGAFLVPALAGSNILFAALTLFAYITVFLAGLFYSVRPNLVLSVKSKGAASPAVDIRRTSTGIGGILQKAGSADSDDHTGFKEIYPEGDAERAIREIGAVINDIQKMGDYAVSKWESKE